MILLDSARNRSCSRLHLFGGKANVDGFVKNPSAALRFNFVVAAHPGSALHSSVFARLACRGELRSPIFGRPPDAPTIETIVPVSFYEIINV
jgi:hypothetical protein